MKINLNTMIRVRLTPQGKLCVAYWVRKRDKGIMSDYDNLLGSDVQIFPLWKFMSIFEGYMLFADVQKEFFPDGIEIVEEPK